MAERKGTRGAGGKPRASRADQRKGIYRLMHSAGLTRGRRINDLSFGGAEGWFWRVHAIADDHGRFEADPYLCRIAAAPLRSNLTDTQVQEWLEEMGNVGLVGFWTADRDRYGVILDWNEHQPAGRNGRRVQKFPPPPGAPDPADTSATPRWINDISRLERWPVDGGDPPMPAIGPGGSGGGPRESGGIQNLPGESGGGQPSHPQSHTQTHPQAGGEGVDCGEPVEKIGFRTTGPACCEGGRIFAGTGPERRIERTCPCPEGRALAAALDADRRGTQRAQADKARREAQRPDILRRRGEGGETDLREVLPDIVRELEPEDGE